jgi:hypothetical protein
MQVTDSELVFGRENRGPLLAVVPGKSRELTPLLKNPTLGFLVPWSMPTLVNLARGQKKCIFTMVILGEPV